MSAAPAADCLDKLYSSTSQDDELIVSPCIETALCQIGQPLQFGLRALVDIPKGSRVCWYGGKLRWKSFFEHAPAEDKTHVRSMPDSDYVLDGNFWASQVYRPVPKDEEELKEFLSCRFLRFICFGAIPATQPIGWLANSPGSDRKGANVFISQQRIMGGLLTVPFLKSSRDIQAGESILCVYGNEHNSKSHVDCFKSIKA